MGLAFPNLAKLRIQGFGFSSSLHPVFASSRLPTFAVKAPPPKREK